MKNEMYQIVYCSRNLILGSDDMMAREIAAILSKSRTNNARSGITGALLYNSGNFAQVLEGSLGAIEKTFEVIQRDPRHSDVTVVEIGPIAKRQFPEWSMAFSAPTSRETRPEAIAAFDAAFAHQENAGRHILAILQELVVADGIYDEMSAVA